MVIQCALAPGSLLVSDLLIEVKQENSKNSLRIVFAVSFQNVKLSLLWCCWYCGNLCTGWEEKTPESRAS